MAQTSPLRFSFLLLLTATLLAACSVHRSTPPEPARQGKSLERNHEHKGPTNWFMNQRRSVNGTIPLRARARALEAFRSETENVAFAPGTWVNVGPRNIGGRVTALAVDPNASTHLWLGSAAGGVWTSTDSGTNWTPVFDAQTAQSIGALAVHPTDSNTVWVGTGEDNGGGYSYDGEGIFKTTNGGATWTNMGLSAVRRIGKIAVDPSNGQRVFAAAGGDWFHTTTDRGIYRTTDGGATWQQVLYVANDTGGIDLAIDPSNPNRIYAALWQRYSAGTTWYIGGASSGIYRSLDGGTTWTELTSGLPATSGRIGLAIAPAAPSIVYACIISTTGRLDGVYRSTDSGNNWTKMSGAAAVNQFSSYSYYFSQIRVDPENANTIYGLDVNLWRSTNAGVTFSSFATSVHVDWHDLILEVGGRWLAGTDGGFFRSLNNGGTFFKAVTLPITQLYDLGICAPNPLLRFAGAQDNFTQKTSTGGTSDWVSILGGDGLQCEVDPTNCNRVVAESQFGNIYRSTNGGTNMSPASSGIDVNDRTNWNAPITLHPTAPSTLYTATYRVYRSNDWAVSWAPISADLSNGHPDHEASTRGAEDDDGDLSHLMNLIDGTITVVSISKIDTAILWAGTDDGNVWVSTDAGSAWTQVNPPGTPYWVTDIEPSRFDADTAYLTVTGYREGDKLPYVRVTRDLGQTWEDLSAGLPQVPVTTILPSSVWRGRLFVGDDLGVLLSDDDGLSWSELRTGMPYAVVMDLVENTASNTLFAGTHARSIYTYDLGQLPPADGDEDGVDNNTDCALRDPGSFASPTEVTSLSVSSMGGMAFLSWTSLAAQAGPGTGYDVAIGVLSDLGTSGTSAAMALACNQPSTSLLDDGTDVPSGAGVYYLVRGRNACGTGSWGRNSLGVERTLTACP